VAKSKEGTETPVKRSGNRVGFPAMELDSRHGYPTFFSPQQQKLCTLDAGESSLQRGNRRFVELNLSSLEIFMGSCLIQRRNRFVMRLGVAIFHKYFRKILAFRGSIL